MRHEEEKEELTCQLELEDLEKKKCRLENVIKEEKQELKVQKTDQITYAPNNESEEDSEDIESDDSGNEVECVGISYSSVEV